MKISIDIDDNDPIYSVLDTVVLGYLKHNLDLIENSYNSTHPDDIKQREVVGKALRVLIDYYT